MKHRYALYNSWKNDTHKYHPKLLTKKVDVQKKARSVMKRLCKDNTKPSSRVIGKISHYAPGYLFDYVITKFNFFLDNIVIGPKLMLDVIIIFRYWDKFKYLII
jgi:THO complex subunit 2